MRTLRVPRGTPAGRALFRAVTAASILIAVLYGCTVLTRSSSTASSKQGVLASSFDKHASCKARIAKLPHIQSPRALAAQQPRQPELATTGVLLRSGGMTKEGYGSFFHRIKSSIVLAMLLEKTLVILEPGRSEHNYSVAAMINEASGNPSHGPPCELKLYGEESALLDSACRSMQAGGSGSSGGSSSQPGSQPGSQLAVSIIGS